MKRTKRLRWDQWEDFLYEQWSAVCGEYPTIAKVLPEDTLNWGDALRQLDKEHGGDVESAVKEFSKTGQWPQLTRIAGSLLVERLHFALGLVTELKYLTQALQLGESARRMTQTEALHWFLVESWKDSTGKVVADAMHSAPHPDDEYEPEIPDPIDIEPAGTKQASPKQLKAPPKQPRNLM